MKIGTSTGDVRELTAAEELEMLASFPAPVVAVPALTARQLRLGLVTNGFSLDEVEAAIAVIEDPQQREVARVEWEYAAQFERDHRLIAQVGMALGLTDAQIDAMWAGALSL